MRPERFLESLGYGKFGCMSERRFLVGLFISSLKYSGHQGLFIALKACLLACLLDVETSDIVFKRASVGGLCRAKKKKKLANLF